MNHPNIKIPVTAYEIDRCHEIREYVLRESFSDVEVIFNTYDRHHPVHGHPNISLIYSLEDNVLGSVRMDKEFEHLSLRDGELRLALFAIDPKQQGCGHGRKFFENIKGWCKENSIHTLHTNSRLSSCEFWSKLGFVENIWDEKGLEESEVQMTLKL